MRRLLALTLSIAMCAIACSTAVADPPARSRPPLPSWQAALPPDITASVQHAELVAFLEQLAAADFATAVWWGQAQAAAVEAARPPATPTMTRAPSGGHSDAWWTGVASCEQGGRNDPYFGYFSFMDGSQGGKPWAEQVAAGNAVLAASASESPAWAPSCVAAGYSASPGG